MAVGDAEALAVARPRPAQSHARNKGVAALRLQPTKEATTPSWGLPTSGPVVRGGLLRPNDKSLATHQQVHLD